MMPHRRQAGPAGRARISAGLGGRHPSAAKRADGDARLFGSAGDNGEAAARRSGRRTEGEPRPGWWARALARQCRSMLDDLLFSCRGSRAGIASRCRCQTLRGQRSTRSRRCGSWLGLEVVMDRSTRTTKARTTDARGRWRRSRPDAWQSRAQERIAVIEELALQAGELARMEYDFLFDEDSSCW
jgi:cyclic beta-1,2-glucan synthetase